MPGIPTPVEPVKTEKDIKLIKKHLGDNPRNFCLFTIGINTAFRASDLVILSVGLFRGKQVGDTFRVLEKKTKKWRTVTINQSVHEAVQKLMKQLPANCPDDTLLFPSRKGINQPMTRQHLHALVQGWCHGINLRGAYGSHTLRKTWGYAMRTRHNVPIEVLMDAFGHSSQKITLRYLCIQQAEVRDAYLNNL